MYRPIIVEAKTLGEAWEEAVVKMATEGTPRFVEAPDYQTWTVDAPLFVYVEKPMEEPRVSPKLPMPRETLETYVKELLEGTERENDFDYTYYSRLRYYPEVLERGEVPNVPVNEDEGGGKIVRVDQVKKAIEIFRRDPTRRSVVLTTWIVARDLEKFGKRAKTSSPCAVIFHPQIVEGRLHMFVYMKTNDLFNGFPGNAYAFTAFQKYLADELGYGVGFYVHYTSSAHIYEEMFDLVEELFGVRVRRGKR